jgi:hypothetical protein
LSDPCAVRNSARKNGFAAGSIVIAAAVPPAAVAMILVSVAPAPVAAAPAPVVVVPIAPAPVMAPPAVVVSVFSVLPVMATAVIVVRARASNRDPGGEQ